MDEQPPRTSIPLRTMHTTQQHRHAEPTPARATTSPIGVALGCLLAGAWFLGFARWFGISGWIFWCVAGLGGLLVGIGLLLAGASLTDLFGRSR